MTEETRSIPTRRSRLATSIALALISFPAVGMWALIGWGVIEAFRTERISQATTFVALAGLAFIAFLLTLLAFIGWRKYLRSR